jgi:hypothetical protein
VRDFRMIERHYFKDTLVKSFDFAFGFCIPGSTNSWEAIYDMPALSETLINDMIDNPYETRSDSFYFADGKLIMHNKAAYKVSQPITLFLSSYQLMLKSFYETHSIFVRMRHSRRRAMRTSTVPREPRLLKRVVKQVKNRILIAKRTRSWILIPSLRPMPRSPSSPSILEVKPKQRSSNSGPRNPITTNPMRRRLINHMCCCYEPTCLAVYAIFRRTPQAPIRPRPLVASSWHRPSSFARPLGWLAGLDKTRIAL